jgi:hypothetical protein
MTYPAIPALGVLLLSLAPLSGEARAASLQLPGGCAVAHAAGLREGAGAHGAGFDADRLEVVLPGLPGAALHAAHLHASGQGAVLTSAVLEQAATAAASGLLAAVSGHRDGGCPDPVLHDAAAPLAHALVRGGRAEFTWTGVSIRSGSTRLGARRLSLRLEGDGSAAHLTTVLEGAVSNDPAAGLLPEALAVRASLPADQLPALLSATGGHGAPVDVTIEQADARRGATTLSGQGHAVVAATPEASSGQGHLTAHGFDTLLDAATASGLARLRTGLFLAKLVAHRQGDQADWDLAWQQGTLTVNNVPLPLR